MAHQGLHGFLGAHVYPPPFGPRGGADPGKVSGSTLGAIALGRNVMNDLRAYLAWRRRLPGAQKPIDRRGYMRRIVARFAREEWVIFEVEAPVLVREWDLNTRLDVVVWDARLRKFMQVEIKIGYPDFMKAHGTFYAPMNHVPNTGVNRALAQAVLGTLMTQRDDRFDRETPVEGVYVMWVTKTFTRVFRSQEWCVDFMTYIRALLDRLGPSRRDVPPSPPPRVIRISRAANAAALAATRRRVSK